MDTLGDFSPLTRGPVPRPLLRFALIDHCLSIIMSTLYRLWLRMRTTSPVRLSITAKRTAFES